MCLRGLKTGMNETPKVSIIIPAYNLRDVIIECIESVLNSSYTNHEVIVVDNASTDGTYNTLKQRFPNIKLVRSEKNLGVTGGRNLGLRHTSIDSEYVLFLDHDMIVDKNMISELLTVARANNRVGVVAAKIYFYSNKSIIWAAGSSVSLLTGRTYFNAGKDEGQFDQIMAVQVAPAVIFVKREVIDRIGGFDDIFFLGYDDTDFCFRARNAGFEVFYTPSAIAYHKVPIDFHDASNRLLSRAYYIGRNRIIFMRKFSKHFRLFLFLIPAYLLYYSWMCLRFKRVDGLKNLFLGTVAGLNACIRGDKDRRDKNR